MVRNEAAGRRARSRLARHTAILRTALRVVTEEGLEALTMQRVADDVDIAVGTIYGYFPSKGALVAEVQRHAIDTLTESYVLARADLERYLAEQEPDPRAAALTRLVAFGRFWIACTEVHPEESQLQQMLLTSWREVMSPEESARVVPSALRLLDQARACVDDAEGFGVLDAGDSMERVVVWAAALNGVLLLSRLATHDEELFDGPRLAATVGQDLLRAWGAPPALLAMASAHVDVIAARGSLAPPVPDAGDRT